MAQESSLNKLFSIVYPNNNNLDDVLIKVCSLNDFYSTNILNAHKVAKHIVSLNVDGELQKRSTQIVNKIALVKMTRSSSKNFYSFATKYCSHHFPEDYPIFDSYVCKMLMFFKKRDRFSAFTLKDLRKYDSFKTAIVQFQKYYGLEEFTLKQIDQYLWQVGKQIFPNKYY